MSTIDLYYIHRVDPNIPIEVTMRALVELKQAGKIKYIGISEATADTLRRAHKIHPLTAYQMEYSAFELVVEREGTALAKTCRELGIGIVAYVLFLRAHTTETEPIILATRRSVAVF